MKRPEQQLHLAVAQFLRVALRPPTFWTAIDHGVGKLGRAEAGLRKARGVKPGLPDILIIWPELIDGEGHITSILGIELKSPKGRASPAQAAMQIAFQNARADYHFCTSLEQVVTILKSYRIPLHAKLS